LSSAGNGTLALELSSYFFGEQSFDKDVFVADYPGYGQDEGNPSPQHIRDSTAGANPGIGQGIEPHGGSFGGKTYVMGHSLGCAAALMAMH